jgi:hypothetical protein
MGEFSAIGGISSGVTEGDARLAALMRLIDWAEREAATLGVRECAICLQLARVALQSRQVGRRPVE